MQLGAKIGEGTYRECREVVGSPDLCAKVLKPFRTKSYPLGITLTVPTHIYTLFKFGIADINRFEYAVIENLPPELRQYAPDRNEIIAVNNRDTALVSTRQYDFNGQPSKTLHELNSLENEHFWREIDRIAEMMFDHRLYFFDIFHLGNNVIVQQEDTETARPVLIDFKRLGQRMYPFQFDLLTHRGRQSKLLRRLEQFRMRFKKSSSASEKHGQAA